MQYQWSMLTSNRNQPLEFQGKSLNWFLHEGNIVCKWVNLKFKAQFCYSSCWFWTYSTILYQWFGLTQKYVTQNYWHTYVCVSSGHRISISQTFCACNSWMVSFLISFISLLPIIPQKLPYNSGKHQNKRENGFKVDWSHVCYHQSWICRFFMRVNVYERR